MRSQLILHDADKPDLCVVAAFLRLAKDVKEVVQSPDAPLVVYAGKGGVLRDLINAELLKCIKSTAAAAFMHLSLGELAFFSYHSLRSGYQSYSGKMGNSLKGCYSG